MALTPPKGNECMNILQFFCILSTCAGDLCSWRGSGLLREPDLGAVQQVRLRCTEGSVEWVYPSQALRVVMEPNLSTIRHTSVCIKPFRWFHGATVYTERSGELDILVADGWRPEQVYCFRTDGPQRPAIFMQADPQTDISRRAVGFRYELLRKLRNPGPINRTLLQAACRPCNDSELLQAICSSDFVVRGSIRNVTHDLERQTSLVEVKEARVYRQRSGVFERENGSSGHWHGHIHTLLQCQVKPGPGQFLFTGPEHFGEAWLGCAPRFKEFLTLYRTAQGSHQNPCEFSLD